jgi:NPCBM-associated, NEW3 domain of alpha-galactosidase
LVKSPHDSVLDVLARPPSEWRSYLTLLLTRYGSLIDSWQIGDAFHPLSNSNPTLASAARQLREESRALIGDSRLSTSFSITESPPARDRAPIEELVLTVPSTTPANQLPNYLDSFRNAGYAKLTLALAPSDPDTYQRIPRLADWAKRIILARAGGAESVMVPQPWHSTMTTGGGTISFDETLFVTRTLARELRGLRCVGSVWMGHGIKAWLFSDTQSNEGVIAAWTDGADANARTVVYDVGERARLIDLWSNSTPIRNTPEGAVLSLDDLPVVIGPIKASRVALMATFEVDAPGLSVQTGPQNRSIHLANPGHERLRGLLRLRAPRGWRVEPQSMRIDVQPHQMGTYEASLVLPSNERAGDYTLIGELQFEERTAERCILRAPLHVGSLDAEMTLFARSEGDAIHVTQRVTNLSDRPLQLRASLLAPELERQNRLIPSLAPGQTTIREYTLTQPGRFKGLAVRASIEEINGPIRLHQTVRLD